MATKSEKSEPTAEVVKGSLAEIAFTDEQRRALERASGLQGLTGLRLVDLDAASRAKLAPGIVRATAVVMCW